MEELPEPREYELGSSTLTRVRYVITRVCVDLVVDGLLNNKRDTKRSVESISYHYDRYVDTSWVVFGENYNLFVINRSDYDDNADIIRPRSEEAIEIMYRSA